MEFPALIHLLSLILLLAGIALAFSEIRLSGWVLAWILLSGALLVQGFRSILSHLVEHGGVDAATYNVANDWMGLGFSLLIVASMYMMRDEFVKHRLADYKLRVVTAAANDAIMMMDNTGGIVYWNEAAQRIFGYSAQEAQAKKLHKLIVPERYRTDFEKGFDAVRSTGREPAIGKTLELAGLRKDGTEIVTEHSISGVSVDGKWYAICIVRDITERKHSELALRASEAMLRCYVENTPAAVAIFDTGMRYLLTSKRWLTDYRLGERDVTGISHYEAFPEIPERWKEIHRRCLAGATERCEADPFPRRDGSLDWVRWEVRPWWNANGAIGGIIMFTEVITERKRADEEIQGLSKFPSENPNPILRIARDGTLLYINEAGRSLLPQWHLQVGQASPPILRETVFQSMDNGSTQVLDLEHGERVYSFFVAPIVASGYTNLYGRDITERKQAEQTLHNYARRLQSVSRRLIEVEDAVRRKINRELHDRVGASLSALNLNLTILRSQLPQESLRAVGARLEDTQKLIEETTTHVRDLMADLHPPALDDYGLLAALRTYAESLGARLAVPISVHGGDLVPRLPLAAETALFRVTQGALVNAVTHAHAKRIEIRLAASPDRVALTIADDGAGFDVVHASLAHASWGLAIMRERAEAVGAELTVESTPGKGTRVCVEISREKR